MILISLVVVERLSGSARTYEISASSLPFQLCHNRFCNVRRCFGCIQEDYHESVFRKLLQREDKTKYVQLMTENMGNSINWLTKPQEPLTAEPLETYSVQVLKYIMGRFIASDMGLASTEVAECYQRLFLTPGQREFVSINSSCNRVKSVAFHFLKVQSDMLLLVLL